MGITIRDVAQRAGVSTAAVSYVINGRETAIKITDETRGRILAAVRELNYHPNALARSLAQKRTDTVTIAMQYPAIFSGLSGFTSDMMRGASDAALRLGYDLMLHTKEQPNIDEEVAALTDGRADGALLLRDLDDPLVGQLTQRGFPCIQVFGRSTDPSVRFVDCDNVAGGRLAAEHLIGLGHRRLMHLAGTPRSSSAFDRRHGFESALRDHGIGLRADWNIEITFAGASFDAVVAALRSADRPTAVFAWSDEVAVRLITVTRALGLRIPQDLSVIGFDATELCKHTDPPLTSVRQPIYDMASHAFELLTRQIKGEPVAETRVMFPPTLVERGSCGVAPRSPAGEH